MDNENEFNYSSDNHFRKTETPKKAGFGKTVFVPFLSGVENKTNTSSKSAKKNIAVAAFL